MHQARMKLYERRRVRGMLKKLKTVFAWIGGILLVLFTYLLASRGKTKAEIEKTKQELEKAQQKTDEAKQEVEKAEQTIKEAQKQTDEEVEHAKEVEVPSDPTAVADALNDLLERIRGESGSNKQQNCDGCSGRN